MLPGTLLAVILVTLLALMACQAAPASGPTTTVVPVTTPSPRPTATPTPVPSPAPTPTAAPALSPAALKYRLIGHFGGIFYCDPDYYPVAREGLEEQRAREEFPKVQQDRQELLAILAHLGLPEAPSYTQEQQLQVYREHKRLNAIQLEPSGDAYRFQLRTDEGQGTSIEGTITPGGDIEVLKREPAINTCPICLPTDARVDTPAGQVAISGLRPGMAVWTLDTEGRRVAAPIQRVGSVPAPPGHQMVRLTLEDGRVLLASPGHPLADGRRLADVSPGDRVDGSRVVAVEHVPYSGARTYDILPSGPTGLYWADGILVGSTLAAIPR